MDGGRPAPAPRPFPGVPGGGGKGAERADATLRVIDAAASLGTWQAAAWYLERSNPAQWGLRIRAQVSRGIRDALELARQHFGQGSETYVQLLALWAGEPVVRHEPGRLELVEGERLDEEATLRLRELRARRLQRFTFRLAARPYRH
jgi:hypothetical protein